MKTWWVLTWDTYYPNVDNFVNSFYTEEQAREYINSVKDDMESCQHFGIIDVSHRL